MASAKQTNQKTTKTTTISMKKPSKSKCNGSCPVHCKK